MPLVLRCNPFSFPQFLTVVGAADGSWIVPCLKWLLDCTCFQCWCVVGQDVQQGGALHLCVVEITRIQQEHQRQFVDPHRQIVDVGGIVLCD